MEKRIVSRAQRKALERFPKATLYANDFTLARGYAECYETKVEPLLAMVKELLAVVVEESKNYEIHEGRDAVFADLIGNADSLIKQEEQAP